MRMTYGAVALLAATIAQAQAAPAKPGAPIPLCSGRDAERIEIRVIRPAETFRIQPGPDEIIRDGEGFQVTRGSPIWKQFASELCDIKKHRAAGQESRFAPRVVVFVAGRPTQDAVSLDFPGFTTNAGAVAFSSADYSGAIPSRSVRQLLDYAVKLD